MRGQSTDAPFLTIHQATEAGNISEVKRFLGENINVDTQNNLKNTPLHIAALYGHFDIVVFLCEKGADFESKNELNYTPLHYAACWGHEEIVRFLLSLKAKIEARTIKKRTPLHLATFSGSSEAIEVLLSEGADIEARDDENETPLCIAVAQNQIKIMLLLIKKNANIETLNSENYTPLQIAVSRGLVGATELLLQAKANPHVKDLTGNTLLHYATLFPENSKMLSILLEWGVNINEPNNLGQIPLHSAIFLGHEENIKFLLEHGSNVNAKAENDITALHIASYMGYAKIVTLLIQGGAELEAQDCKGNTSLHLAAMMGHKHIAAILIQKGANPAISNEKGNTPRFIAKIYNRDNIAKFLSHSALQKTSYDFSHSQICNAMQCLSLLIEKECNKAIISFEIKEKNIFVAAKKIKHKKFCADLFGVLLNLKYNFVRQTPLRFSVSSFEELMHANLIRKYKEAINVVKSHHELFSFFPEIFKDYFLSSATQDEYVIYSYETSQPRLDDVAHKINQALRKFEVSAISKKRLVNLKFPREVFLSERFEELKKAIMSINWHATTSINIKPVNTVSFRKYEAIDKIEREAELERRRNERKERNEREKEEELQKLFSECRLKTQYEDDSLDDWSEIEKALPNPEPLITVASASLSDKDDKFNPDQRVGGIRLIREEMDDKGKEEAPSEKKKEKKKPKKRQKMSLMELENFVSSASSSSSSSVNEGSKTYTKGFQHYRERDLARNTTMFDAKEKIHYNKFK